MNSLPVTAKQALRSRRLPPWISRRTRREPSPVDDGSAGVRGVASVTGMCGLGSDRLALDPALGAELRAARVRLGLTQEQVAEQVGVGHQFISMLEHAQRAPSGWVAANLTRVLLLDGETARELQRVAETVDCRRDARHATWREQQGHPPTTPPPRDTPTPSRKRVRRAIHDALLREALGYGHRDALRREALRYRRPYTPIPSPR